MIVSPPSYSIALAVIGVESQLLLHFKARCDRILFGVESAEIDLTAPVSDLRIPTSPAAIKTYAHHAASVCRSYSYIPAIFFFRAITKIADAVVIAVAVYVIDHADRIHAGLHLPNHSMSHKGRVENLSLPSCAVTIGESEPAGKVTVERRGEPFRVAGMREIFGGSRFPIEDTSLGIATKNIAKQIDRRQRFHSHIVGTHAVVRADRECNLVSARIYHQTTGQTRFSLGFSGLLVVRLLRERVIAMLRAALGSSEKDA